MVTQLKASFKKWITPHKTVYCPSCQKGARIPVKYNKTLRVTCPFCGIKFQVSFMNPVKGLIKGNLRFKDLKTKEKINLIILGVLLILSLLMIGRRVITPSPTQSEQSIDTLAPSIEKSLLL